MLKDVRIIGKVVDMVQINFRQNRFVDFGQRQSEYSVVKPFIVNYGFVKNIQVFKKHFLLNKVRPEEITALTHFVALIVIFQKVQQFLGYILRVIEWHLAAAPVSQQLLCIVIGCRYNRLSLQQRCQTHVAARQPRYPKG